MKIHSPKRAVLAVVGLLTVAACTPAATRKTADRANELLAAGHYEEALAVYRDGRRLDPLHADFPFGEGLALDRLGRSAEAEDAIREAMALTPGVARHHLHLGHVLAHLERMDDAVDAYHEATRLNPLDASGWRALGFAEYNRKRYAEARRALERYMAFAREADDQMAVSAILRSLPAADR